MPSGACGGCSACGPDPVVKRSRTVAASAGGAAACAATEGGPGKVGGHALCLCGCECGRGQRPWGVE